jgi:transposase
MTVKDAARRAGVSATIVKRWLARGDVAGEKRDTGWEVDMLSLERWLKERPKLKGRPKKEAA